jgi:MFS family permease
MRRHSIELGDRLLVVCAALSFISFAIIPPVLDELVRARFASTAATTLFMSVHGIAALLFGIVGGFLVDRVSDTRRLLSRCILLSGICTALLPHITGLGLLLAVRFLDGAAGTVAIVLLFTLAVGDGDRGGRARRTAVLASSVPLGFLAAPVLVWLLLPISLSLLFGVAGGLLIVAAVAVRATRHRAEPPLRARPTAPLSRLAKGALFYPLAFAFVDRFTFGTLAHLTSLALKDTWNKSSMWSSGNLLLFWLAFLFACRYAGKLCRSNGAMFALLAGSTLYGFSLILLGSKSLLLFFVATALAGAFCAVQYVPSLTLIGEASPPGHRGRAMGLWHFVGAIGMVMGMSTSGLLAQHGYGIAYGAAGLAEIGLVGLSLLLLRRSSGRMHLLQSEPAA